MSTERIQNLDISACDSQRTRRVFDCCLFNGEMDVFSIRLHELSDVVDYFIIVESDRTFSGIPRDISFHLGDPRIAEFATKIRHVVVTDMPETDDPWTREKWQRNAVLRGAPDAAQTDLLVLSDVDEIPRGKVVAQMAKDLEHEAFGARMAFSYFYVNYRNVVGPESARIWAVAATRRQLDNILPDDLRHAVRDGRAGARIFDDAGWHFSYLTDKVGIQRKLAAFSHQEYNNATFLDSIDIERTVREGRDLFGRPGYCWELVPNPDLPEWLQQNRWPMRHLFCPPGDPAPPVGP